MRGSFLAFSRPSIGEAEIAEVSDALRSGWITSGPRVEAFEKAFAAHLSGPDGAPPHALAVTSATAGFHILLQALGIGPGDEVITPSLTWPAAVNMIHLAGARPVFADIDENTLQLDPASVSRAITRSTRAIVPVHFAGQPSDLDGLRSLSREHGLVLIEDAAHAVGTEHRGRRVGSGENPAVFSFHAIKNLTTGEGGMVTTPDGSLRDRLASLRFHGVSQSAWTRHGHDARMGYDVLEPGWKYNLTDLQAALGIAQLRRLEEMLRRRETLARLYDHHLSAVPEIGRPAAVSYPARHAWHLYTVFVERERAGISRDDFREALRQRNIGTGLHFLAVHQLSFYAKRWPVPAGRLPATERAAASIVSLPLFPDMREEDVLDVVTAIRDVLSCRESRVPAPPGPTAAREGED